MLFNSYEYLLFFPIVIIIYYLIPKVNLRVLFLVIASYYFYTCWNPIYLFLILISTATDYLIGIFIYKSSTEIRRKLLLILSLTVNLGILFYYKYYNFLGENVELLINMFSDKYVVPPHHYLLPVGISFYTFQTLSYTVDIYFRKQDAETNFLRFALYVSFFPQLVAGPIERSTNLLPQFKIKHSFSYQLARSGSILILVGLFKKIVIADRFAVYADLIFDNPTQYSGIATILGILFFSIQIYCDFSGYSDIAIGSARLLGIKLMDNFRGPYLSKSIKEFWRRWHISLSTWFRDYLYIPLGGNRNGLSKVYRNLIIVFLATGIWHGANWTFVVWGMFHGTFLILEKLGLAKILLKLPSFVSIIYVVLISSIGWVFFRSSNLSDAILILHNCITYDPDNLLHLNMFYEDSVELIEFQISIFLVLIVIVMHFCEYKFDLPSFIGKRPLVIRWAFYMLLLFAIPILGQYGEYVQFIYFQF